MTSTIDRYQVVRPLGEGATSRVYLAIDPKVGREVAIKVLAREADEELRGRFRLEAKSVAALKHPNIVELYDYSGPDAADLYLVMEYLPGLSLYHFTSKHGPMSEATALCVGHELCLALDHAHSRGVVHRDLKPENVILHEGRVVLADFGAVKAFAKHNPIGVNTIGGQTAALGTPGFMAPEQFEGKGIDPRSDIFSLGAVLYNLTTGRIPYEGGQVEDTYRTLKAGKYTDPRTHHALLSPDFCKLLADALSPTSKQRYASAEKLRERIIGLLALHGVTEVRKELQRYEKQPAASAVDQRERQVDVLLREVKQALRDKNLDKARALMERIETVAPLDERVQKLQSGAMVPVQPRRASARRVVLAFVIGLVAGAGGMWSWFRGVGF